MDVQETIKNNGTDKQKFPDRSPLTKELYEGKFSTTSSGRKRKIESDSGAGRDKALFLSGTLLQSIRYEIKRQTQNVWARLSVLVSFSPEGEMLPKMPPSG